MKFEKRWIGRRVDVSALADGDLFVHSHRDRTYLAMRVSTSDALYALVLAIYGPPGHDEALRLIYLSSLVGDRAVHLLVGGEFAFEPLKRTADGAFRSGVGSQVPNGALAILECEELAIRLGSGMDIQNFDLRTGKPVRLAEPRIWLEAWRLIWRFGDDELELCRVG